MQGYPSAQSVQNSPKRNRRSTSRGLFACSSLALAAVAGLAPLTLAATATWKNTPAGTQDFNTGGNWTGGTGTGGIPGAADTATFTAAEVANPNLSASLSVAGLSFSSTTTSGYTLSDTNSAVLTLTGAAAINAADTSGTNVISSLLKLGEAAATTATMTQAAGGTLNISGAISSTNALTSLTFSSGGVYTLANANTYTATSTTINAATLNIGNSSALSSSTLVLGGSAIINAVGGDQVLTNAVTLSNNLAFTGTNNLTLGAASLTGSRTINLNSSTGKILTLGILSNSDAANTLTVNGAGDTLVLGGFNLVPSTSVTSRTQSIVGSGNVTITGAVADGTTSAAQSLSYQGTGLLVLGGANTYTGVTRVITGTMQLTGSSSGGGELRLGQIGAGVGKFILGGTAAPVNLTVSRFDEAQNNGTANILVGGNASISTFDINSASPINDTFHGMIGGTGNNENNIAITKDGSGLLNFAANNSYGGVTTLQNGGLTISGNPTGNGGFVVNNGALIISGNPSGTGAMNVNGGTLTISGNPSGYSAINVNGGSANITGTPTGTGAVSITNGTFSLSGTGSINNSTGITINGSGAKFLQLSSVASTPGVSLISGTLDGTGSVGATTVSDNASNIVTNGNGSTGALTLASLSFSGAATANVRINSPAAPGLVVTGAVITSGAAGSVTVNPTDTGTAWANGYNDLISGTGITLSKFTLGTATGTYTPRQNPGVLAIDPSNNDLALNVVGDTPVWSGVGGGIWTTANTGDNTGPNNWALASAHTATNFWANDNVQFNDTYNLGSGPVAPATTTVTLHGGSVNPSSTTVNSALNYTFQSDDGSGINSGFLVKSGSGALTITTGNSYTAGTTLNAGTLNINNSYALGSGPIVINGGTIDSTTSGIALVNNNTQNWNGDLTFTGTNSLDMGGGTVTLGGTGTSRTLTLGGNTLLIGMLVDSGTHGLNLMGNGTLVVTGNGPNNSSSVINGILNVSSGTTLQINRTGAASGGDFTATGLIGSGTVTNGSSIARWLFVNATGSSTFAGSLQDGGGGAGLGLFKEGTGTLTLTGNSTFTDVTSLSAGTLVLTSNAALGNTRSLAFSGTSTLDMADPGPDVGYPGSMPSGTTVTIESDIPAGGSGVGISHTLTTLSGAGYGGGQLNFVAGPNVTNSGTANITFTQFGLSAGSVQTTILNPTTATVTLGPVTKSLNNFAQTLDLDGTNTGNLINGAITNGVATAGISILKSNTSTWTLTGNNTYSGTTTISGGTLIVGDGTTNGTLGTGAITNNGTLNFNRTDAVSIGSVAGTTGTIGEIGGGRLVVTGTTTNAINVTSGTLDGTGSVGATTVAAGAANTVANGNGSTGALTLSSLTFNGLGQATVRANGAVGLVVTGSLTTTGSNSVTINATSTTGAWANGDNDLISYGSLTGAGLGAFTLNDLTPLGPRQSNGGLVLNGNNIALLINGDSPKWTGLDSGNWVVGTTGASDNWKLITAGTKTNYIEGDVVVFDDSAKGSTAINISGANVSPTATLFSNSALNYTVASTGGFGIAGTGTVIKSGTGSVTISTNNTFSGGATVNGGSLTLSGSNTYSAATTINPSGTLVLDFSQPTSPSSNILSGSSSLVMGGATLNVLGSASNTNSQTVVSTTLNAGGSLVNVTPNASVNQLVLNLGPITRNSAATVVFTLPNFGGGQSGSNGITTTNSNDASGILGSWAIVNVPGTAGNNSQTGYTYATNSGGNIVPYTNATSITTGGLGGITSGSFPTTNFDVSTNGAGTATGNPRSDNTIRYTGTGSTQTGVSITLNGLLNAGTGPLSISNPLPIGANNELIVDSASAPINLSGVISNNGTNTSRLTILGPSTTTLTGVETYTGSTNVNGGTLQIADPGSIETSSGININGQGAKLLYTSTVVSTRAITLTQGTLDGTGSVGAVTVASGTGGIVTNGNGGNGALTVASLTYSGAGALNPKIAAASSPGIKVTGALTLTPASGQVTVNPTVSSITSAGVYDLVSYGSLIGSLSNFSLGTVAGLNPRATELLALDGNNLALNITTVGQPIVWAGAAGGDGNWTTDASATGGTNHWALHNSPFTSTNFLATDDVQFNDTVDVNGTVQAPSTTSVNISAGNVSPTSTTFNNSSVTYNIGGSSGIAGSGPLTKFGTAAVNLNGSNTYTGGTVLNAGTLAINNPTALGTGNITINGGALDSTSASVVMTNNNTQTWAGSFSFAGTNPLDMGTGNVNLNSSSGVTVNLGNSSTLTVGKIIDGGTSNLTLTGSGTLIATSIGIGTGGSTVNGTLNVSSGATLQINRTGAVAASSGDFAVNGLIGAGTIANGGASERWLFVTNATNETFSGTLTNGSGGGGLGLNKNGVGTLTLAGTNSYTGQTTVNAGALVITGPNSGPGTSTVVNAGTLQLSSTTALGSTANIQFPALSTGALDIALDSGNDVPYTVGTNSISTITIESDLFTPGPGVTHTLGALTLGGGTISVIAGPNVIGGAPAISAGAVALTAGTVQTTTFIPTSANITLASVTNAGTLGHTLDLDGTSTGNSITGGVAMPTGALNLVKSGTSTWTIGGSSTYTGGTNVTGGTLVLASGTAFPANTALTIAANATLQVANHGGNAVYVPNVSALINNGTIDLTNNDLLIHNTTAGAVFSQIHAAYNNGKWNGNSGSGVITSSSAATDNTHLTAVGFVSNISGGTYDGQTLSATTDALVKTTYYGDADLDGSVTSADYTLIDAGFLSHGTLTGWQNGDFNYDSVINGSDYTLIDNAFNTQGANLASQIANPGAAIATQIASAGVSAVPEPTSLGLVGIAALGLLGRRKGRVQVRRQQVYR